MARPRRRILVLGIDVGFGPRVSVPVGGMLTGRAASMDSPASHRLTSDPWGVCMRNEQGGISRRDALKMGFVAGAGLFLPLRFAGDALGLGQRRLTSGSTAGSAV